jgi:hypothetical protein
MNNGQKESHLYQVGAPYIPGKTSWAEGAEYNWRGGEHELRFFFRRVTDRERTAIRKGPCTFALAVHGPVVFFLYRFGEAIPWSDAPYSYHMVPEPERTVPPQLSREQRALLHVILVNADSGLIEALRTVSLAPVFSRRLHEAITLQAALPFDQALYDRALDAVYRKYPTSERLLQTALVHCEGGQ